MRRRDREVTDLEEITKIINKCEILHLGLVDNGVPYVVPLNFSFAENGGQMSFFFHSALEGRKIDIMKRNPFVCFELDCFFKITEGDIPCEWSAEHESVIGYGEIQFIEGFDEKKAALDLIMKKYGFEGTPEYSPNVFSRTALYKLSVSEITGKRNVS